MPPLLYADDMVLLATSAAGLQRQLDLLQHYCSGNGLTVNTVKTKLMLLSGQRRQGAAQQAAEAARLSFRGQMLEVVTSFKYLGITFHSTQQLAGAAVAARTAAARGALHMCNARCAELGIEAAPLRLRLFSTMVDSVLSYGAEVWGPQLAAAAVAGSGSTGCAAQRLHQGFLRQQLGVSQSTPAAVVLAEAGERPLWLRWLMRSTRLLGRCQAAAEGGLLRRALSATCELAAAGYQQCWAAQVAAGLAAVGLPLDLQQPCPPARAALRDACWARQQDLLMAAAHREGASRLQHYVFGTCGGDLSNLGSTQQYLCAVRERRRRQALAQLRTGSHWGAEETGRWKRVPCEQRVCPHCAMNATETVSHMTFDCPRFASVRARFSDLFADLPSPPTLHSFFHQPGCHIRLARFAAGLHQAWQEATVPPPAA